MDQHLLLVVLMYLFLEIKAQALLPPKLTVNPPVITETDSVTLNCQTPSSVSVDQCHLFTLTGQILRDSSCLQTHTGTELLKVERKHSPVEVKVMCFYTVKLGELTSSSPRSQASSIAIHSLLPPKLTVNPPVITETDSVTLNCQTPSSVSVDQCHLFTLTGEILRDSSCLQTLTGTELLKVEHKHSPVEVKVMCFYTVKLGELKCSSPRSQASSITIHSPQPKMTVNTSLITETDSVTLNCQTPSSVPVYQCFFYSVREQSSRNISCVKTLTGAELLKMTHQTSPAEVELTCYYTKKLRGGQYQSPLSNIFSINIQSDVEIKPSTTQSMLTYTMAKVTETVRQMTSTTSTCTLTSADKFMNPTSGVTVHESSTKATLSPKNKTHLWKLVTVATGFGVTVGLVILGLVLPCTKRRGKNSYKRSQTTATDYYVYMRKIDHEGLVPTDSNKGYSVITSVLAVDCPTVADSERLKREEPQNDDSDLYHVYSTIPEEPAVLKNTIDSSLHPN